MFLSYNYYRYYSFSSLFVYYQLNNIEQHSTTIMSNTELPIKNNKLTVKAITYSWYYNPLALKEIEIPVVPNTIVKPTELLVKVHATSINPVDCIFKGFSYGFINPKNKIIGGDFSGVVVKAGPETNFKVGDKIYGDVLTFTGRGSSSEYILFEPSKAIICEKIPEGIKFEEAASLPIVSGTAYQCLKSYGGDLTGKNVLVLGAGTSVGTYSVQLAKKYFGAKNVVATCSSKSAEKTKKNGADIVVDYTKNSKINELLEFVKVNGKFDIVVDTVRDESVFDYFNALLKPVSENGILTQVKGSYTIDYSNLKLSQFLPSLKKLTNSINFKLGRSPYFVTDILLESNKGYGDAINKLWTEGKLNISMDSIKNAYTDYQEAYDRVASGKASGKVVMKFVQ